MTAILRASLIALLLAAVPAFAADPPRVSTGKPFAKGDIFVAATVMDVPDDDHAGTGRIFQYDEKMNLKGEIWLQGSAHKVGFLGFGPGSTLWAFSPNDPVVMEIGPDGKQKPLRTFSPRSFSSVNFAKDGTLWFGEHLQGKVTSFPNFTTKFHYLPGRDVIGDGVVEHFTADGKLLKSWKVATHGGVLGFHAVTSTVLTDNDTRIVYISETGNVIKQFDLVKGEQLPDLAVFNNDPKVGMTIVMVKALDGSLMVSTGKSFFLADPKTGAIRRHYPLEGMGWAALAPTIDGTGAIVGNFFTGDVIKVAYADGAVVARSNIGQKRSLSGITQFAGP